MIELTKWPRLLVFGLDRLREALNQVGGEAAS